MDRTYTFQLKQQELAVISELLANAPFRMSAPVIATLQKQINEQDAAFAAAAQPQPQPHPFVAAGRDKAAS